MHTRQVSRKAFAVILSYMLHRGSIQRQNSLRIPGVPCEFSRPSYSALCRISAARKKKIQLRQNFHAQACAQFTGYASRFIMPRFARIAAIFPGSVTGNTQQTFSRAFRYAGRVRSMNCCKNGSTVKLIHVHGRR